MSMKSHLMRMFLINWVVGSYDEFEAISDYGMITIEDSCVDDDGDESRCCKGQVNMWKLCYVVNRKEEDKN
ncbi:hypothetical protein BpHYR1_053807 [Brachionus plicatilis]|uniref:Uncharacterized protein n=1 Tax=Brachionus plicatilis TaxID=10195 RepID=A0A3M7TC36_BRAPC|nr:hypothetical protein BpHYR1_053807 [Brachionus plicatilis]